MTPFLNKALFWGRGEFKLQLLFWNDTSLWHSASSVGVGETLEAVTLNRVNLLLMDSVADILEPDHSLAQLQVAFFFSF